MAYTIQTAKDFETGAKLVKALSFLDVEVMHLTPLQGKVQECLLILLIWDLAVDGLKK